MAGCRVPSKRPLRSGAAKPASGRVAPIDCRFTCSLPKPCDHNARLRRSITRLLEQDGSIRSTRSTRRPPPVTDSDHATRGVVGCGPPCPVTASPSGLQPAGPAPSPPPSRQEKDEDQRKERSRPGWHEGYSEEARGGGSSVGRAPGCGPGGRGFESHPPPFGPVAQRIERRTSNPRAEVRLLPGPFFEGGIPRLGDWGPGPSADAGGGSCSQGSLSLRRTLPYLQGTTRVPQAGRSASRRGQRRERPLFLALSA
jgi:hypothetical protein